MSRNSCADRSGSERKQSAWRIHFEMERRQDHLWRNFSQVLRQRLPLTLNCEALLHRAGPPKGLLFGFCLARFEINVDLLADDEGSWIGQIHDDLQHLDVAELMRIVGIDPALTDNAGDG